MAIEWATISVAALPLISKHAKDTAEKLAGRFATCAWAAIYRRLIPDAKLEKANELFVLRFSKELDATTDLQTITASSYETALVAFLANPTVQDAIEAPLDGESELDWKVLRGIWNEIRDSRNLSLVVLPEDFDWARVAKTYSQAIRTHMIADRELRSVVQAVAELRAAEATVRAAEVAERMADGVDRLSPLPRRFDLSTYAKALRQAFGHLKFGSLDPDWTQYDRRMRLETIYVPQSVRAALPPHDQIRDYLRHIPQTEWRPLPSAKEGIRRHTGMAARPAPFKRIALAALRTRASIAGLLAAWEDSASLNVMKVVDDPGKPRTVILGDPGLGKSTLLKKLALMWAEDGSRPLTLFIELRRAINEPRHRSFVDYLETGPELSCCLPRQRLHEYLESEPALVLFDGLDEVEAGRRSDAVSNIIRFAADYPKARLIVTTRIQGYHPGSTHPEQFRDAGFEQFTLQDFNDPEINQFIQLWHAEAFSETAERDRYESRLRIAIETSPAIRELAGNPLLLTMMAILSRNQDLPRDRTKLYEKCAELLLRNWDLEKFPELRNRREPREIRDKLGPDQKMRILERVAASMQQERMGLAGNLIPEDRLKRAIEQELNELEVSQPWSVAEDLIWMLRERNFMLAYLGDHKYGFIHRTFLEFFCAREITHRFEKVQQLKAEDLETMYRKHYEMDEWREILRLLCGLINARYAARCVSTLLDQQGGQAAILAAQCIQEIREVGAVRAARARAHERLGSLLRESQEAETTRLRALHELARGWKELSETLGLIKKVAASDRSEDVRRAAIQEIVRGWKGVPDTLKWLCERADCDDRLQDTIVAMVANTWKKSDEALAWLKERATINKEPLRRGVALNEIAQAWRGDTEVLNWIKGLFSTAKNWHDKETAVQAIAKNWKAHSDTLSWIKDRGIRDEDPYIRCVAVREIARGWSNAVETLSWIQERYVQDQEVRKVAVIEAARAWGEQPRTLSWLKDRAVRDEAPEIRQTALEQVARIARTGPETVTWLQQRAADDSSGRVRSAALQQVVQNWREDARILPWLKERATLDEDAETRAGAVDAIARDYEKESTLQWVRDRSVNDSHADVRRAAVEALTRHWKDDSETLPLIKDRATRDQSGDVRQAALEELVSGWEHEAWVILLRTRAAVDEEPYVRRTALREFAHRMTSHPDTLCWLKDRADNDDHWMVRQAAIQEIARTWRAEQDTPIWLMNRAARDQHRAVRQTAVRELARGWDANPDVRELLAKAGPTRRRISR